MADGVKDDATKSDVRRCRFCGERAGNKEHIIAQALIERMGREDFEIVVGHQVESDLRSRTPHNLYNLTTKSVCKTCNNGWMSKLEAWFLNTAGPLVEPEWPKMANEHLKLLLPDRELLANWMLKTAITMAENSMMKNTIGSEVAEDLFRGKLPGSLIVDIGFINHSDIASFTRQVFMVATGGQPPRWMQHKEKKAFHMVLQLNHLALRLARIPDAVEFYQAPDFRHPLRCYRVAHDPYKVDFRYHSIQEFSAGLILSCD